MSFISKIHNVVLPNVKKNRVRNPDKYLSASSGGSENENVPVSPTVSASLCRCLFTNLWCCLLIMANWQAAYSYSILTSRVSFLLENLFSEISKTFIIFL